MTSLDVRPQDAPVDPTRGRRLRRLSFAVLALGLIASVVGLLGHDGLTHLGTGYLLGFSFCWAIVLGSLFFVALQHVTSSVWSVVLRRVAEVIAAPMWLLALLFVPLVLLAFFHQGHPLFSWTVARESGAVSPKAPYLNTPFFVARNVGFFVIWIAFTALFVRQSLKQDRGEGVETSARRMRKWSGPFLVIFALTVTFASFDWLMSLSPKWYSTIFGTYVFAGMTLSGLAAITLGVVAMRSRGWLGEDVVRSDHLYSLGGLLFAFTCFWAYMAFSQYMLMWYGNLPEEINYMIRRTEGGWTAVSVVLAFLRFGIPFFLLLSSSAKRQPRTLAWASVLILLGQLLDLYWIILPSTRAGGPPLGFAEIGPSLVLLGVLGLYWAAFLRRHRAVAVGDPSYEASLRFHL